MRGRMAARLQWIVPNTPQGRVHLSTSPDTEGGERPSTQPAREVRRLTADGIVWQVHEIKAPRFDRRRVVHLIFESPEIVRRVRVFPADWQTLDDDALYALCTQARHE